MNVTRFWPLSGVRADAKTSIVSRPTTGSSAPSASGCVRSRVFDEWPITSTPSRARQAARAPPTWPLAPRMTTRSPGALTGTGSPTSPARPRGVDARGQLRDVVGRRVRLDPGDLPEVVDGVRGVAGTAAHPEDEEPAAGRPDGREDVDDPADRVGIEAPGHLHHLVEVLANEVHL